MPSSLADDGHVTLEGGESCASASDSETALVGALVVVETAKTKQNPPLHEGLEHFLHLFSGFCAEISGIQDRFSLN